MPGSYQDLFGSWKFCGDFSGEKEFDKDFSWGM